MAPAREQPKWFTPLRLLILFCSINMLNYVDRGIIASNGVNGSPGNHTCKPSETCSHGSGIQGDFKLSNFQDGVLSSAFMGGLLVASPFFAEFAKSCNPFRLIGVGLSVWTLATAGCAFSFGFWSITMFRLLVGVGEASFISLAAPFINNHAPEGKKSSWLAYFYTCMPVGVALGYVFGGVIGTFVHWRAAFLLEALFMLPFAIFGFVSDPVRLIEHKADTDATDLESQKTDEEPESEEEEKNSFLSRLKDSLVDFKQLFQSRVYVINVLGYIAFNFVLGAYSYWGPKAGEAIYHMKSADILFGVVTIVCGIAGTFAGGQILDFMGSTNKNGFKLLAIATFVGGVACFFAFFSKSLVAFIFLFAVGEMFLFATQGPVNQVTLQSMSTKEKLQPLAMATSTVLIHVFGDVPSSPLVGKLQDTLHNWRSTALILTSIYLLAAFIWACGFFLYYFGHEKDDLTQQTEQERPDSPLLDEQPSEN